MLPPAEIAISLPCLSLHPEAGVGAIGLPHLHLPQDGFHRPVQPGKDFPEKVLGFPSRPAQDVVPGPHHLQAQPGAHHIGHRLGLELLHPTGKPPARFVKVQQSVRPFVKQGGRLLSWGQVPIHPDHPPIRVPVPLTQGGFHHTERAGLQQPGEEVFRPPVHGGFRVGLAIGVDQGLLRNICG
ncbi:hypothetical protein CSW37_06390 [Thermus scotoductus]|uniref:Uncharacterized protein n=1 Tax=Thermus scotoductus TaxID=37636 RepID=A0A430RYD8_THESC|nr:hypothetical protein CSW40_05800 [Thermus scotoductus]RTH37195.1 hypothetical protein CSW37_06390 [Thermus scotoductus]RTI40071.1 hypothetical protein CSW18_05920 [Thermus scotoductus]